MTSTSEQDIRLPIRQKHIGRSLLPTSSGQDVAEDAEALTRLLRAIEREGAKYGLKLNHKKCELIAINSDERMFFKDGASVPHTREAKYLG